MYVKMTLLCLPRSQLYSQYQPQQSPLLCWIVQLLVLLLSLPLLTICPLFSCLYKLLNILNKLNLNRNLFKLFKYAGVWFSPSKGNRILEQIYIVHNKCWNRFKSQSWCPWSLLRCVKLKSWNLFMRDMEISSMLASLTHSPTKQDSPSYKRDWICILKVSNI